MDDEYQHWRAVCELKAGNNRVLSCGIVAIASRNGEPVVLLLRAYRYWDFPKGQVEADEDPFAAAVREFGEETGLPEPVVADPHAYFETEPYGRGKVARYYLGETTIADVDLPVNPELGRPEHHEARWCSLDEAGRLLNARVNGALEWATSLMRSG